MKKITKILFTSLFAVSVLFVCNSCDKNDLKYENVYSEIFDMKLEGQVGDAILKPADQLILARVYSEDYTAVELLDLTVSFGATTSIQVGETIDFSASDSQDITVTAEIGESTKTYTITIKKVSSPN